jgi:hypothetical protein
MDYNALLQAVGSVGFPIVAFFYIVVRMEKKLEELTRAINELENSIVDIKGFVNRRIQSTGQDE